MVREGIAMVVGVSRGNAYVLPTKKASRQLQNNICTPGAKSTLPDFKFSSNAIFGNDIISYTS